MRRARGVRYDRRPVGRVDAGGHGSGKTQGQVLDERAELFAFARWQMGVPGFEWKEHAYVALPQPPRPRGSGTPRPRAAEG